MGAPHPHTDTLKGGPRRRSTHTAAQRSCQVNDRLQVYVQGGRVQTRIRRRRRLVSTLFLCLVSVCSAHVVGQRTTVWDPLQHRVQALAEVPAVRARLDHGAAASDPTPIVLARARGHQVRRLARARALLSQDAEAGLSAMRAVWADCPDPDIQQAALDTIVMGAADRWPDGYRGDFLTELLPGVLEAARVHRVPPSVTLAQAVLESGWGRSGLAKRAHNLFGVKAGASSRRIRLNSREHIRGRLRPRRRTFRVYDSVDEAILHHARILSEDRRYAHARPLWTDWPAFLEAISPRYASSPRYPTLVSEIIELYALDRWDAAVVRAAQRDGWTPPEAAPAVADAGEDTGEDTGAPAPRRSDRP